MLLPGYGRKRRTVGRDGVCGGAGAGAGCVVCGVWCVVCWVVLLVERCSLFFLFFLDGFRGRTVNKYVYVHYAGLRSWRCEDRARAVRFIFCVGMSIPILCGVYGNLYNIMA